MPTAANIEEGDKTWLLDDLNNPRKLEPKSLDIVDIAALPKDIWRVRLAKKEDLGLALVNFHVRLHLNFPYFLKARDEYIKQTAKRITGTIYAIDDDSAIKVIDNKLEVVSSNQWLRYN